MLLEEQEAYREAIALDPQQLTPYMLLAEGNASQGLNEEALSVLTQAMDVFPGSVIPFNSFGVILSGMGRHEEAAEYFVRALELDGSCKSCQENLRLMRLYQEKDR